MLNYSSVNHSNCEWNNVRKLILNCSNYSYCEISDTVIIIAIEIKQLHFFGAAVTNGIFNLYIAVIKDYKTYLKTEF